MNVNLLREKPEWKFYWISKYPEKMIFWIERHSLHNGVNCDEQRLFARWEIIRDFFELIFEEGECRRHTFFVLLLHTSFSSSPQERLLPATYRHTIQYDFVLINPKKKVRARRKKAMLERSSHERRKKRKSVALWIHTNRVMGEQKKEK